MNTFLSSVWWLIVALGVLVTFHELGHYWAARLCGVRVLRFSVGWGKPLWSYRARSGTEWAIAPIPLGGYVSLYGDAHGQHREEIPEAQRHEAHDFKPVYQRMFITFAGPFANLVLCVALLWLMFVIGRPDYAPVAGRVEGIAAAAGIRPGDTLLAFGDRETPTWTEAGTAMIAAAVDGKPVQVRLRTADGVDTTRTVDFSKLPAGRPLDQRLAAIGFTPRHELPLPLVGDIQSGSAAEGALAPGDRILAIGGQPIRTWDDIAPAVARIGQAGGGTVEIERDGHRQSLRIVPKRGTRQDTRDGPAHPAWLLGIGKSDAPMDAMLRYGPLEAFPAALGETRYQLDQLLGMLRQTFSGRLAARDTISGPVGIAQAARIYAERGLSWYLSLLAMLSLSLCVLNLLPVPILDGGRLLYYLIELLKGRPLSEGAIAAGQYVGLALVLGLMGLAFSNDLQRLIP